VFAAAQGGRLWPCGIVPYQFDSSVPAGAQAQFIQAASLWESVADVHFVDVATLPSLPAEYIEVFFINSPEYETNVAWVGDIGGPVQNVELDFSSLFVTVHELGHVLGLIHEHQRPDRNQYLTVSTDPADFASGVRLSNFNAISGAAVLTVYDWDSIMHYRKDEGAAPGHQILTPLLQFMQFQNAMGQRTHISVLDAAGLSLLYPSGTLDACVDHITVTPASASVDVGGSVQLSATAFDKSSPPAPLYSIRNFLWSTADPTVATVDSNGSVTGVGTGSAFVTAALDGLSQSKDGSSQITVTCQGAGCPSPPPPCPAISGGSTLSTLCGDTVTSLDPNDKAGSQGAGTTRYISGATPLRYTVSFGNDPTATAPAQRVTITDQLDQTNENLSTFTLGPITFPNQVVTPPSGPRDFSTTVDLRPANNLLLAINTHLDQSTGLLNWTFQSLDPTTNQPPTDPTAGFLPPGTGGSTFFTVMPKHGLATNTQIRNQASIVFDVNSAIPTQTWLNTLDNTSPTSSVQPLPSNEPATGFTITWSGSDVGAGVQDFTVYVSDNGGAFTPFLTNTTATSATFTGQSGHTYGFYSIARDLVYNVEAAKTSAEATTQAVTDITPPVTVASVAGLAGNNGWYRGPVTVTFSATDPDSAVKATYYGLDGGTALTYASPFTISSDGIHQLSFYSADPAGNQEKPNALTLKIDSKPPTVTISAPSKGGIYLFNAVVASSYTCSDAVSGVATCNGPVPTGSNFNTTAVGPNTFTVNSTDAAGNSASVASNYNVQYAPLGTACLGAPGHMILQPINADGSSVFKQGSTVPAKFRVCDAKGVSIGTPGVVSSFALTQVIGGTSSQTVNEAVVSTTPDTAFRWDATNQQWIFNISTKSLSAGSTYVYTISLNDGTAINFQFGLE
jgi:hypothetical protein